MLPLAVLTFLLTPAATQAATPPSAPPAPAAVPASSPQPLPVVEAPGFKLVYQRVPWSQNDFEAVERGVHARAAFTYVWPIAYLETTAAFSIDGSRLGPGRYAVVFHPNADGKGMVLELTAVPDGSFLRQGRLASRPAGVTAYRGRLVWEVVPEVAPRLSATVVDGQGRLTLTLHLGDRTTSKVFRRA